MIRPWDVRLQQNLPQARCTVFRYAGAHHGVKRSKTGGRSIFLAVPDAVDGQELFVEEVAHDIIAGDPLTHPAGLVDLPTDVRVIDEIRIERRSASIWRRAASGFSLAMKVRSRCRSLAAR